MRRCPPGLAYAALVPTWIAVHLLVLPTSLWQDLSYLLSSLPPLVLLLRAARRLPPAGATCCRTLALACGIYALGNACYLVQAHVLHTAVFIAPSDVCFLLSALTTAVALTRVGRSAVDTWTLGGLVDLAVVLLGFGLLFHTLIAGPVLARQPDLLTLTTTLVYPVVDLLVLLLSARLAADPRRSAAGAALLTYSLLALLSGGTFAILGLLGTFSTGDAVDALFLARNLGLGLVVLVPGVEALLAGSSDRPRRGTGPGALVLPAGLLGPAALLAQMLTGDRQVSLVTALIGTCLGWAVLARLALTLAVHRRLFVAAEELEARLQHRIAHDALTGLANRTLLERQLLRLLLSGSSSEAPPHAGGAALLYVDLNDFKQVNDTLGHAAGDRLLVQVGQRLTRCAREQDTVARLAGDEFALLLQVPVQGAAQAAQETARRVRAAFDEPFALDGHLWHVSASIGVGLVEPGDGLERVLHRADTDMYAHKKARKAQQEPLPQPALAR